MSEIIDFTLAQTTKSQLRTRRRYGYAVDVIVRPLDGSSMMLLESRDVSATGIFLRSPLLFDMNTEFVLEFPLPDGTWTRSLARVTRHELHSGIAGMGLTFSPSGYLDERRLDRLAYLELPVA